MKLRDYQKECVFEIQRAFQEYNSQLVQLPTGAGKTVVFWHFLKQSNKRAVIVAPSKELVEQIHETGERVVGGRHVYAKKGSYLPKQLPQYLVLTVQSMIKRHRDGIDLPEADFLIFDEAHRASAERSLDLIHHYLDAGTKVLGLTATPERLDGKSLLDVFQALTYSKTLVDLVRRGHLTDIECYRIRTRYKLTQVAMSAGDIAPVALRELDAAGRNEIIINTYLQNCRDKKTLMFCLNVNHAQAMAKSLRAKGIAAEAIYGSMKKKERRDVLNEFKQGQIQCLCNCQLLTEGFDEPSIQALILARPTKSKSLYCQMIGRGVRPYPGKDACYVYDITDEIHDIVNFNVLGGIPKGTFEWGNGERLTQAAERHAISVDEVDVKLESFDLYDKGLPFDGPAFDYQKRMLRDRGIYFDEDITIEQAAYILFKLRMMTKHDIDYRDYYKKWHEIPSSVQTEGWQTQEQKLC